MSTYVYKEIIIYVQGQTDKKGNEKESALESFLSSNPAYIIYSLSFIY